MEYLDAYLWISAYFSNICLHTSMLLCTIHSFDSQSMGLFWLEFSKNIPVLPIVWIYHLSDFFVCARFFSVPNYTFKFCFCDVFLVLPCLKLFLNVISTDCFCLAYSSCHLCFSFPDLHQILFPLLLLFIYVDLRNLVHFKCIRHLKVALFSLL